MKLNTHWALTADSFPINDQWVPTLLNPLSNSFTDVYLALNGNLTIGDNIVGTRKTITFTTSPTYTAGKFTSFTFPWPAGLRNPPYEIRVGKVSVPSPQSQPLTAITINNWVFNAASSSITVLYVTGLANSTTYTLNIVAQ